MTVPERVAEFLTGRRSDRFGDACIKTESEYARLADQMLPSCVIVTVCPPMVTVPVRDAPLLKDAPIETPPLPSCGFG